MNLYQYTISEPIEFSGIGVHSGQIAKIILIPAEIDAGFIFYKNNQFIKASIENIEASFLCTSLSVDKIKINTTEHLLSALYALGITNLKIEVNGSEIPILDGSAYEFVNKIIPKLKKQKKKRSILKIKEEKKLNFEDKYIIISPAEKLKISYYLDYNEVFPRKVSYSFKYNNKESYIRYIARAKTFGFLKDYEYIKKNNLALGSNKQNTVVITENNYLVKPRYKDEIARHKVLDCLGDLALTGKFIIGEISCYKTGHREHLELVKYLQANY